MNNKILIGSIFAVALLLLMPSIPAIQQKTLEDTTNNIVEQKDYVEIKDVKEIKPVDDDIKFPWLLQLVTFQYDLLMTRSELLRIISLGFDYYSNDPIFPLMYYRSVYLRELAFAYSDFWKDVSIHYGCRSSRIKRCINCKF
jgi:hypothetical protein